MSAHLVTDELDPSGVHDLRCLIWVSSDPADDCDCRDPEGHAPRIDTDHPATVRASYERAWHQMPLSERAAELDRIAAGGHR